MYLTIYKLFTFETIKLIFMTLRYIFFLTWLVLLTKSLIGQTPQSIERKVDSLQSELQKIEDRRNHVLSQLEDVKLAKIRVDLKSWGLPGSSYIEHSAMILSYNEQHEQASWVAHIIIPDIRTGSVGRTNDFREDPKVLTGTAEESDYFLKYLQEDSSYIYDGFGYDRGHLAPSADFRWSAKALSESYFYSNMSPQRPDFNRRSWAELESLIRSYVYDHPETQLYVVTGPILHDSLPTVPRARQSLSIPEQYFKVVVDMKNQRGIGFLMPNRQISRPINECAFSIRELELTTGYNFGSNLSEQLQNKIEKETDVEVWLNLPKTDVLPLEPTSLPAGHFNTTQAKIHMGKNREVLICGTVVSMRKSNSGNLWLNLDKTFPNHVFSAYIPKSKMVNFPYDPSNEWSEKKICIEGKVQDFDKIPTIRIDRPKQV